MILPPIRRGDLTHLIRRGPPGVVIIADGYFHLENLSVGHAEIREALSRGWEVWGVSSMGAIRAAELHGMGMKGAGAVFERFRDDPEFRDDEVALLHEPTPPFREVSEPLIHTRCALDDLVARGELERSAAAEVISEAMSLWFGNRTLGWLRRAIGRHLNDPPVATWLAGFDRYRIKCHDLLTLLAARPWRPPLSGEPAAT